MALQNKKGLTACHPSPSRNLTSSLFLQETHVGLENIIPNKVRRGRKRRGQKRKLTGEKLRKQPRSRRWKDNG